MGMGGGDHQIGYAGIFRYHLPDIDHCGMKHTDQIQGDQCEAGGAVVQDHRPGPDIVMYPLCRNPVSKTCNPIGIEFPVAVQVLVAIPLVGFETGIPIQIIPRLHILRCDRHGGKAGTQHPGMTVFHPQIETIAAMTVTQVAVTESKNQDQKSQQQGSGYLDDFFHCFSRFLCNSSKGR
jgi:hypothetical protein